MLKQRPTGWRYEVHRHSLAAKGVRTVPRYNSMKDAFADGMSGMLAHPGEEEATMARHSIVDQQRASIMRELDDDVRNGKLREDKKEDFMKEEFAIAKRDFQEGRHTASQFKEDVHNRYKRYRKLHSTTLNIWSPED